MIAKKIFFWTLCLLLTGASLAGAAPVSENRVGRTDIGISGSAAIFGSDVDDSGFLGGNLSYGVTPHLALGVSGGYTETSVNDNDLAVGEFMAEMIIRLSDHPFDHKLVPYGVVGLGGMYSFADRAGNDDRDDGSFAWKLGVGADWILNPNWALNGELAYHSSVSELPYGGVEDREETIDFWTAGGGLKYIF